MYKYLLALAVLVGVSGCAHFSINGMMCDELRADRFSTIPAECRNYSEARADKAFKLDKTLVAPGDLLIFQKQ